jgi:hypothetical protein
MNLIENLNSSTRENWANFKALSYLRATCLDLSSSSSALKICNGSALFSVDLFCRERIFARRGIKDFKLQAAIGAGSQRQAPFCGEMLGNRRKAIGELIFLRFRLTS